MGHKGIKDEYEFENYHIDILNRAYPNPIFFLTAMRMQMPDNEETWYVYVEVKTKFGLIPSICHTMFTLTGLMGDPRLATMMEITKQLPLLSDKIFEQATVEGCA